MRRLCTILAAATAITLLDAGCASRASSMSAAYDRSLARWKGVSRAELVAAWGTPEMEQTVAGDELTYVVRNDFDMRRGAPSTTVTRVGDRTVAVVMPSPIAGPGAPVTCTTRFAMKNGVVASWTFEGIGCGAPQ
jgi:hypothetical protein